MKKNKSILLVLAAAILATGYIVWRNQDHSQRASIRIAANLPMSGQLSYYGVAVQEGAKMAIEEAKATPGSALAGISIDWQDNASEPRSAVSILQKQILDNPTIYLSGVKPQTMAIKDEVTKLGYPHFVYIFDAYINAGTSNNIRTWLSYKIEPPMYFEFAKRKQTKKIAIAYIKLPHAIEEFEKIIMPAFQKEGISMVAEPYDLGRSDFKDIAAKLEASKPDLFILNGFQSDLVGLIRSLRPLSAIKDGNTICTYDLLDAAKILGADELEGIRLVAPLFESRPQESTIADWRARFKIRYGKEPSYTHAFAFDMMKAIDAAARLEPKPVTHEDWIKAIRSVNVQGVTGTIKFDADGDMITPLEIGVYRQGKLIPDSNGK